MSFSTAAVPAADQVDNFHERTSKKYLYLYGE